MAETGFRYLFYRILDGKARYRAEIKSSAHFSSGALERIAEDFFGGDIPNFYCITANEVTGIYFGDWDELPLCLRD